MVGAYLRNQTILHKGVKDATKSAKVTRVVILPEEGG